MTDNDNWNFTPEELRIAARVARASRGLVLPAAAAAWELRADLIEEAEHKGQLELALWPE